jgi:hypothetical protein
MSVQMGSPATAIRAHEELFAYWSGLRHEGRLPSRADIDPGGFRRLLPGVCLIDVRHNPRDYRVRLAGTGLYGVFGGEITGKRLAEIYAPPAVEYWRGELDKIVDSARPGVGYHSLAWRGAAQMTILWLRLPLARDGRSVDMMLGYDSVVGLSGGEAIGGRAA